MPGKQKVEFVLKLGKKRFKKVPRSQLTSVQMEIRKQAGHRAEQMREEQ